MIASATLISLLTLMLSAAVVPSEAASTTVCALSYKKDKVLRWNGHAWDQIGESASAIYGGPRELIALTPNPSEGVYSWSNGRWSRKGGGGAKFVTTNVALYALNYNKDSVWEWVAGEQWRQLGGSAENIWGGGNAFYAVGRYNRDLHHHIRDDVWERVGGGGAQFAVDGAGSLYGLSWNKDAIFKWTGRGEAWDRIGDRADRIWAGGFGMFATTPSNDGLYRHIGGTNWQKIGNGGREYAVTDEGIYGLTENAKEVYRWNGNGENWTLLPGSGNLVDIQPCP